MKDYKRLHGKRKSDIMYECCISLAKYLLCIFNFIFFVSTTGTQGLNFTTVEVSIAVKFFTETGLLALCSNP
jgi:hypothetical protein